jgi:hypothetical protein
VCASCRIVGSLARGPLAVGGWGEGGGGSVALAAASFIREPRDRDGEDGSGSREDSNLPWHPPNAEWPLTILVLFARHCCREFARS